MGQSSGSPRSCLYARLKSILYRRQPGPFLMIKAAKSSGEGNLSLKPLPSSDSLGIPLFNTLPVRKGQIQYDSKVAGSSFRMGEQWIVSKPRTEWFGTKRPHHCLQSRLLCQVSLDLLGVANADEWLARFTVGIRLDT